MQGDLQQAMRQHGLLGARVGAHVIEYIARYDLGDVYLHALGPHLLFDMYLVMSYAYYQMDDPLVDDAKYDELCKRLQAIARDKNADQRIRALKDRFAATTGFDLDYNQMLVPGVAPIYHAYRVLNPLRST